ncbi:membrane protein [Chryseobacterium taiwanense]|uniref:Membrane protein n=2 Tax=Chryseobacterium taiwanense TaxID=363331 RepID=A0A0B4E7U8_9FLAO|nr:membrane protein [Chryseobacterium taiwanense]
MACKKKETMIVSQSTDSTVVTVPADSGMTVTDSITVSTTRDVKKILSEQDKEFAENAARGGIMEVMMGKLASDNAGNTAVKALGKMMVTDHTKANEGLAKWASEIGYTLPTTLDSEKQKKYDELKVKKGAEFDKMYTDFMVSDHKEDIKEFKKEASEGSESTLKSFASKTLPTLEHHLMESEKAKDIVK